MGTLSCVGLRREDMYQWERRTPLVPEDVRVLTGAHKIPFVVQSSTKRAYSDAEYQAAGLPVEDTLAPCPLIIGLKEVPVDILEKEKTYVLFSHVIKGQPHNMPMLQRALDLGCTIIDYERMVDDHGRRLIAFGSYAGLAGMIDTLWSLGRRLTWEGIESPFSSLQQAMQYADLEEAKRAIREVGQTIRRHGLPKALAPLVIGISGYGNVSKGAQEILDLLPVMSIDPSDLLTGRLPDTSGHAILKAVFREEHTVARLDPAQPFDLQEFYQHPERYAGAFERYLPFLTALVNCIYWEPNYPRLVTRDAARRLYAEDTPRLRVIGDISCDVLGSIEITVKATEPDDPVYVIDPATGDVRAGVEGHGPVILAVEILPSELPREASAYFSNLLKSFIPDLAATDFRAEFEELNLPPPLQRAVICHHGALTPNYQYIRKHLVAAAPQE